MSTAVASLPGMPNASSGTSAPPSLASCAASGASTPRMSPEPNASRFDEVCTACP